MALTRPPGHHAGTDLFDLPLVAVSTSLPLSSITYGFAMLEMRRNRVGTTLGWLVIDRVVESSRTTTLIILAFAAVQIVVHIIYFPHRDAKSESGWNMLALIFTMVLVVITLSGSIWIMYRLTPT